MKKVCIISFLLGLLLGGVILLMTSCNKQIFDTTYNFNYAYIKLPTGEVIEGSVNSWKDWDDGSSIVQVKLINGTTYLTHYSNVVLISK